MSLFHRGALGDSVLCWPILRAAGGAGWNVTFVTDRSKGALAQRELGVTGVDAEQPRFNSLWLEDADIASDADTTLVIAFLSDTPAAKIWSRNVTKAFPRARVRLIHEQLDRSTAFALASEFGASDTALRTPKIDAPTICHVGAGGREKRWPMIRWRELVCELRRQGESVHVIAGEVEAERFETCEREIFHELQGRFISDLDDLYDELIGASRVIIADSGPGHLAAQLGIRVISLFGPTDPKRWAPIGPDVHVIAPSSPSNMTWLEPERVIAEFNRVAMLK